MFGIGQNWINKKVEIISRTRIDKSIVKLAEQIKYKKYAISK